AAAATTDRGARRPPIASGDEAEPGGGSPAAGRETTAGRAQAGPPASFAGRLRPRPERRKSASCADPAPPAVSLAANSGIVDLLGWASSAGGTPTGDTRREARRWRRRAIGRPPAASAVPARIAGP